MKNFYSNEKHVRMLISLLKQHKIKKIVISPGAQNVCFVASIQQDNYFELYSSVDERSAAYIACGLAAESGECVALSCTGATASRNYVPGLTEAYYRKLPILAITSMAHIGMIGHNIPQVIDRSNPMNDIAKLSVIVGKIHEPDDEWHAEVEINKALLELKHHGGGPVHINLENTANNQFGVKELEQFRMIQRIEHGDEMPQLSGKTIAIFVGAHKKWSDELTDAVEHFCEKYEAIVLCDQTSNYKGKYRVLPQLVCAQNQYVSPLKFIDVLIHIGDVSGAYCALYPSQVWRVNPDGEIRDTFRKLKYVFEMEETAFFNSYAGEIDTTAQEMSYYNCWKAECNKLWEKVSEIPFSNPWIALQTGKRIPENSVIHFGILNSLRAWNFFELPQSVFGYSNTGGFGIDGCVSSLIGASLYNSEKLYFGIVGDLAFFYDMNSIGNRHVGNNIRLMVVNNGRGTEFKNYFHTAAAFGDDADSFMAAAGHYGNQSRDLVKKYAECLGFKYLSACNKIEYMANVDEFVQPGVSEKPILFEVFTDSRDESDALKILHNLEKNSTGTAKNIVRSIVGEKGIKAAKKILEVTQK